MNFCKEHLKFDSLLKPDKTSEKFFSIFGLIPSFFIEEYSFTFKKNLLTIPFMKLGQHLLIGYIIFELTRFLWLTNNLIYSYKVDLLYLKYLIDPTDPNRVK